MILGLWSGDSSKLIDQKREKEPRVYVHYNERIYNIFIS